MKVILKKLELVNYRNITHGLYEFDGNSKIVGENRIGKTNTLEAIVWLLTDKLLNGSTDISSIKPLEDTKKEVRVEGTFLIDEKEIVIAKEYGEDWVKTRGTNDLVFKGHYLNYIYNGVPQKTKGQFYDKFKQDFGIAADFSAIEITRLLIDPYYVGDLGEDKDWKNLRAFIISLVGNVSDKDVFEKDRTLSPIYVDLENRMGRVDELKKYYTNTIKGLQESLVGDDAQIELLEKTEKPSDQDVAIAKKTIEELEDGIRKLQNDETGDSAIVELDKEINEKKAKVLEIEKATMNKNEPTELQDKLSLLNDQYREALMYKSTLQERLTIQEGNVKFHEEKVEECLQKRKTFIEKLRAIDEELAKPFQAKCPTCGHELDGEQFQQAKAKWELSLNSSKQDILTKGKENKADKESFELSIENLKKEIEGTKVSIQENANNIKNILKGIEETNKAIQDFKRTPLEVDPRLAALDEEIQALEYRKVSIKADILAANAMIREKITEKMNAKVPYRKVLDDLAYYERQAENLETVRELKKEHQKELARIEQKRELIEVFIRTKLEMLDERVSSVFGNIKFQLIKENINGGYDPVCKPYIYDIEKDESTNVSWKSGSKSERVVTGIAICEKIKEKLGLADLPFLFDEGGEISTDTFETKFKTNSQLICVKVMDNIKTPMVMKV